MWQEQYDALSNYEKGEFRRLGNYLLSHSYIVREGYHGTEELVVTREWSIDWFHVCSAS